MSRAQPGTLVAARAGNAGGIVIGYGEHEHFIASDLPALLPETRTVAFLDDGERGRNNGRECALLGQGWVGPSRRRRRRCRSTRLRRPRACTSTSC